MGCESVRVDEGEADATTAIPQGLGDTTQVAGLVVDPGVDYSAVEMPNLGQSHADGGGGLTSQPQTECANRLFQDFVGPIRLQDLIYAA